MTTSGAPLRNPSGRFLFSAAVAILFGYSTPHKASRPDPREALRYE
jgi:hypothetical protein